jgi:hypothetical protein
MLVEDITQDRCGKRVERAIAWASAKDQAWADIDFIASPGFTDLSPEAQVRFLERFARDTWSSFGFDGIRFLN